MPAPRKFIYIGPLLDHLTAPLAHHLDGLSNAVNVLASRYAGLLAGQRPNLTLDEWCAVAEDNNGIWTLSLADSFDGVGRVPLQFVEQSTAAKWQVDAAAINRVLADLSPAGRLAVVEVVERFWADESGRQPRAVLQEILGGA
jgi:hypothetical protein